MVPLFPLPNVVHFPHTLLPLHVFEPRYRRMVADTLDGERVLAMAVAREEVRPEERPRIHPVGSIGKIELIDELPDGRYHLLLEGLARVRIGKTVPRPGRGTGEETYWTAELELLGEALPDLQDPEVAESKADLLLVARR